MKKSLAIALFALTLSPAYAAADHNPQQDQQIKMHSAKWMEQDQKAAALMKQGKFAEAETLYKSVIAERQKLGLDLLTESEALGTLYLKWNKKQQAEDTFKMMVDARAKMGQPDDPQMVYPLNAYANCLAKIGKTSEAKQIKARAAAIQKEADATPKFGPIKGTPGSPENAAESEKMRLLGERWMKNDLQNKALLYFQRAVQLDPTNATALCNRGEAEVWFEKNQAAMADFNKAIKLKPDLAKAYVDRAFLYEELKQYPQTYRDFEKAVELNPKDTETMGSWAKLLDENGKHVAATSIYSKAISTDPSLFWPYVQRAEAYKHLKQWKQAVADLTTLVDRSPDDPDYHQYRAEAYLASGDLQNALADFNKLIELNPKYSLGYYKRAKIYEKLDGKKTPRVIADYAQAKKLGYVE